MQPAASHTSHQLQEATLNGCVSYMASDSFDPCHDCSDLRKTNLCPCADELLGTGFPRRSKSQSHRQGLSSSQSLQAPSLEKKSSRRYSEAGENPVKAEQSKTGVSRYHIGQSPLLANLLTTIAVVCIKIKKTLTKSVAPSCKID